MKKAFLLMLLILAVAIPGYARDNEDLEARRALRERREKLRAAHLRIQKCLVTADLEPCFANTDLETAAALLAYYEKRNARESKGRIFWADN